MTKESERKKYQKKTSTNGIRFNCGSSDHHIADCPFSKSNGMVAILTSNCYDSA